jgi:hypothetical protein
MRPDSIRKFDMLWLGALALGVVAFVLSYGTLKAQVDAQLADAGMAAGTSDFALMGGFAFGIVISLALWFLVSRLRLEFVKWILILLFVWGLINLPAIFADGFTLIDALSLIGTAMQAAAIYFLFRPDAKAWFAAKGTPGDPQ